MFKNLLFMSLIVLTVSVSASLTCLGSDSHPTGGLSPREVINLGEDPNPPEKLLSSAYTSAEEVLIAGLESLASEIDLTSFYIPKEQFGDWLFDTLYKYPHIFYATTAACYSNNGYVTRILPEYAYPKDVILSMKAEYDEAFEKAIDAIPKGLSETETVLAVNDWLATHIAYDHTVTKYDAYTAFVEKTTVCQGYALAFIAFMNELGMESVYVASEPMNHAWNLVKVNGEWYHVDVTWNDPSPDTKGAAYHSYLLLSDAEINDSEHNHYGWDTSVPDATSTTYDNYFWEDVEAPFIYTEKGWLYVSSPAGTEHTISSYDFQNNTSTVVHSFSATWYTNTGGYWIVSPLIAGYKNKVYYTAGHKIYSVNFDGTDEQVFIDESNLPVGQEIYGMYIEGNMLTYSVKDSPTGETIKKISVKLPAIRGNGDINGDNAVDLIDVWSLLRRIAWNMPIDENSADVNLDNTIDMEDVLTIRQFIVGLNSYLPTAS
ncbi:MAG: dockerin type I domain-containing protein [Clostridiales bacterium]|jgi:hypothetical protein|nr:dockerin type I domain-containing protein [Clostridiales bacterium]